MVAFTASVSKHLQLLRSCASDVIREIKNPVTWLELGHELEGIGRNSLWPAVALTILVILNLDMVVLLGSWAMVMFSTKMSRKSDTKMFEKAGKYLYKNRCFVLKMTALLLTLAVSKATLEGVQIATSYNMEDESRGIWSILVKIFIKWLAYLQYFSFYQVYLNAFAALGYYISPLNKVKEETPGEFEANERKAK